MVGCDVDPVLREEVDGQMTAERRVAELPVPTRIPVNCQASGHV